MNEKACFIFAAGSYYDDPICPNKGDLVIAADAGFLQAKKRNIPLSLAIGDMDSLQNAPDFANAIILPSEKDDTDTLAAIRVGLEKGYRLFHIYGGTGGERFDHTLANIQCLAFLSKKGARGYLYDKNQIITAITDGSISFLRGKSGFISVFSLDGIAEGVTEKGLKYTLDKAQLKNDFPIGVSNRFLPDEECFISVEKGTLIIVYPK